MLVGISSAGVCQGFSKQIKELLLNCEMEKFAV